MGEVHLAEQDVPFRLAVCGERFGTAPGVFAESRLRLGERVVHWGFAEPDRYAELLRQAQIVVSTSRHEFFGVAVLEAVHAGARPLLPNRLVYPERIEVLGADPATSLFNIPTEAADLVESALTTPTDATLRTATHQYDWKMVAPQYDAAFEALTKA